ncbi:hypothetical protein J3R30DRAFT_3285435 [Lentinula aciculospora]|uniref:BSD domain-containing protein n=1 Tax=Lentinula aciculospora TaxID=153920 RepID=A0A9W9ALB3_9AGAR|nr:hypothetical protein J3R30DRAFT_3285435 [Lentinula aciculospora]
MTTTVCTAKVIYKKIPGILELTDTYLQWTQNGQKAPSVRVPHTEASSLFCSKEGAPQVKLKIALFGDDNGHNFTFVSPTVALGEREKFKAELTAIIARNRKSSETLKPIASTFSSTPTNPTPQPLRPGALSSRPSTSRATSVSSENLRATPIIPGTDPAADFRHRKNVFLNNPELAALHRELVAGGHISEAEFWEGREHLIYAQEAQDAQRKGKSGVLVDPRTETVDGVIQLTPQLIHDTFEQYPVVAKAYNETVPSKLSEAEFWTRYFRSKLFNAHRASIRSAAAQHVVKDDPIFDKYLEKDDDELEPRRQRDDKVELFVDLGATREDHEQAGNEQDITMQAGRQKGALPLIRKFNEHSERLLNSALQVPLVELRSLNVHPIFSGEKGLRQSIDIEDLHRPESSAGIALEMQDRQRYFEGQLKDDQHSAMKEKLDIKSIIRNSVLDLQQWDTNLAQLKVERKPYDAALLSMTQNVHARLDVKARKTDLPEGLFRQMRSCQTAANEFLRQFWTSACPPTSDGQILNLSTPAQRTTKATKMIAYLSKTHEKVAALVQTAQQQGIDPSRVEVAMQPVLNAVDRALNFHNNKKMPGPHP